MRGLALPLTHCKLKTDLDTEKAHKKSRYNLTVIDHHLANKDWLELNRATIADTSCFPYIALAYEIKVSLDPYPNIEKWIVNIKELPNIIFKPGLV